MKHKDFKIISGGKELPYPMMRLLAIVLLSILYGYFLGVTQ